MAAVGIVADGVTESLKKLSSVIVNEITLVWDFKDELKNLQSTLNMILAVMEDAEKKQVSEAAVRLWMEELKSAAYDADDILDEYYYEIIRKRIRSRKVRKPSLIFRWRMAHKIKEINEKLNKIAKRKNDLGLQTITVGSSSSSSSSDINMMMMNRETYSLVVEDWKILGRENDKSTIIKMLLLEEVENSSNSTISKHDVSVISIVGMGGLGKTTMAQLVYNDEVVQKHFQLKFWICVSDPFDVKKLFKNIVNSIGSAKQYNDATTMDDIAHLLQDAFRGKKFLLVLDDVWNENSADWYKFKTPLMVGAEGSKILVTTRSEIVAEIMGDQFQPYELGILNENDCWSLFKERAFGYAGGAKETLELVEIGKEMVKRCGGLPLAVIFLGGLMRSKKKVEEWKVIRDTKLWHESREGKNEILPSLRLSYDYLPSHLKQCFSYCCLFPKDWEFHREKLIRLWMAEGFLIESPGENTISMEEIGNEYFHNLLCNFFFHDAVKDEDGDIETCKMHDLVYDLARSVVGNHECLIVESADDVKLISETTRRLNLVSLDGDMLPKVLEGLKNAKNLRTIVVNTESTDFDIGNTFNEYTKRLRVLDLSGSCIEEPTSSIGGLKHLRYLDGDGALLPKGIGRLSFLQTLSEFNVGDKKNVKNACVIEELEGLNLLRGDLRINDLQNVTSEIDACRANLKEKKYLRKLFLDWNYWNGSKGNNSEVVMEGLRPHSNLRMLGIRGFHGSKLPRWIEDSSCLPNLVKLTLHFCKCEQLVGFGGLPSLRSLTLWRVVKLECIGKEFYYSTAGSSSAAGGRGGGESSSSSSSSSSSGEASTTTVAFPSLKKLTLYFMDSLKEWVVPPPSTPPPPPTTTSCFPLLEEIEIWSCPLLTTITPTTTIFPSLKVLNIHHIHGRAAKQMITNNLNSLTSLRLDMIHNLVSLPHQGLMENNNTLLSLSIKDCRQFRGFLLPNMDEDETEEDQDDDDDDDDDQGRGGRAGAGAGGQQQLQISQVSSSSSLKSLKLYDCPALRFFPDIRSLTSLRELEIDDCEEFKSLQGDLTCLSSSLEHLEYVKIRKSNEATVKKEVFFEWRKSSFL